MPLKIDDVVHEVFIYAYEGTVKELVSNLVVSEVRRDGITVNTGRMKYAELGEVIYMHDQSYKSICLPDEVEATKVKVRAALAKELTECIDLDTKALTALRALV